MHGVKSKRCVSYIELKTYTVTEKGTVFRGRGVTRIVHHFLPPRPALIMLLEVSAMDEKPPCEKESVFIIISFDFAFRGGGGDPLSPVQLVGVCAWRSPCLETGASRDGKSA